MTRPRPKSLRVARRVVAAVLALLAVALWFPPVAADLDVTSPPGRPLEWEMYFYSPTANSRAIVPYPVALAPDPAPARGGQAGPEAPPIIPELPPRLTIPPVHGLFGYFNVLTPDFPAHIDWKIVTEHSKGNVAVPYDLSVRYPPEPPPELIWDGMCSQFRMQLHGEVVYPPECQAHIYMLGEAAALGCLMVSRNLSAGTMAIQIGRIPPQPPTLPPLPPADDTPFNRMVVQLAVNELCNGYPYALDPCYCRHLLALGDDAAPAVLACAAQNSHTFLKRNAVALLGTFRPKLTGEALKEFVKSKDPVIQIRALRGLIDQHSADYVPLFLSLLDGQPQIVQVLALEGLGELRDPRALPELKKRYDSLGPGPDTDVTPAWLRAVVQIGGNDNELRSKIKSDANRRYDSFGGALASSLQEPPGYRKRLLWELSRFALVALGDREAIAWLQKIKPLKIHRANWFALCEAYQQLGGNVGLAGLRAVVTDVPDLLVKLYALRMAHSITADPSWLKDVASKGTNWPLRAFALAVLVQHSPEMARPFCAELLAQATIPDVLTDLANMRQRRQRMEAAVAKRLAEMAADPALDFQPMADAGTDTPEAEAHYLQNLITLGSRIGAYRFAALQPFVRKIFARQVRAQRLGTVMSDEVPVVSMVPPLLESAVYELGRSGDARMLPLLLDILRSEAVGAAEAAIALGNFRMRPAAVALVEALQSDDPWIRCCAYLALKHQNAGDFFANWLYGPPNERAAAVEKYGRWLKQTYPE